MSTANSPSGKVLVVGGGGREHALAWRLAQSPGLRVFVAPGNGGTALEPRVDNVPIAATDIRALASFAAEQNVDYTVVGPEQPLAEGIVDHFHSLGQPCLGPSRAAAQLESSKAFAKDFLARHGIPTAAGEVFDSLEPALARLRQCEAPVVIKADGLAAGKGVIIAASMAEAEQAVYAMLSGEAFGPAGQRIIIEECLLGQELSFIALVDGEQLLPLAASQDHKARDDGDRGPNTGGMGAYSPVPLATAELQQQIVEKIIRPTISGMAAEGNPCSGFLYAGLMVGEDGSARVLEFNCRLGDPETQPLLMRLRGDFNALLRAAAHGELQHCQIDWSTEAALGVVLAAKGYPGPYQRGERIGLPAALPEGCKIFHAGTRIEDGVPTVAGGRVLCATAMGADLAAARSQAYALCRQIDCDSLFHRGDIGHRALAQTTTGGQRLQ